MLKLSIIRYLVLSLVICTSPKSILKGLTSCPCFVDFLRKRWTMGVFFERLSFNVE